MTTQEIIAQDDQYLMHTYGRYDMVADHGVGATIYDPEGKAYIDFTTGIGVSSLGYANEKWVEAICEQAKKLGHISNLFHVEPASKLAKILCERTGLDKVFFASGGGEANEGMIKLARKYSFDKYGQGRSTIITLRNSFHGRTITTLTATGQDSFHNWFFPLTEGFRYAEPDSMEALQAVMGDDVCGIMVELIQGEGGVFPLDKDYMAQVQALCKEKDILLMVDEVQTGVGRSGKLFAFQQYDLTPDVITFAKGIAGGVPMSGVMCCKNCADVLCAGTHGTTFGGNPIAAAAGLVVQETLDDAFLEEVNAKGAYLRKAVEDLNLPCLGKTRGMGLMIGIDVNEGYTNKALAKKLIENGLLILTAGPGMRMLPPLTITYEEMDAGVAIMAKVLAE